MISGVGAAPLLGAVPCCFPRLGEGALGDRDHLVDIEGLGQVLEGALLVGGDGAVEIRVRGGDDHRQPGCSGDLRSSSSRRCRACGCR
jgi:hypothetical protein